MNKSPVIMGLILVLSVWCQSARSQDWQDLLRSADSLSALQKHDSALVVGRLALQSARQQCGPEDTSVARALHELGTCCHRMRDFSDAESYWRGALEVWEKALGPDNPEMIASLSRLARLYKFQGKFAQAEALYQRALDIRIQNLGSDHIDVATSLANLAIVYRCQGKYAESEPLFERSLTIREKALGPDHPAVADGLRMLANIYADRGRFAEAESLCERSLAIVEQALGPDHPHTVISLRRLANIKADRGKFAEAEWLAERSVTAARKTLGPNHPEVALCLNNLGLICAYQGKYAPAESCYTRSLDINEQALGPDHPRLALCLEFMSELRRFEDNYPDALSLARRACRIRLRDFADNATVLSERHALAYSLLLRKSVDNYLSCFLGLVDADDHTTAGVADVALAGKGIVSDEIFDRLRAMIDETDEKVSSLADSLSFTKYRLSELFVRGPGSDAAEYRRTVDSLSKVVNELEVSLSRRSTSFRIRQDQKNVTAARICSLLPERSVLIEYLRYNCYQQQLNVGVPHYLAMVLAPGEQPIIVDLGEASEIDSLIDRYRKHMLQVSAFRKITDRDQTEYKQISGELSNKIWRPVASGTVNRDMVLIAPDGALNIVSFAGLTDSEGKYLVEQHAIHYLSCGRDLIRLQQRCTPASGLFALGDPDYDMSPSAQLFGTVTSVGADRGTARAATMRGARPGCDKLSETLLSPLPATRSEIEQVVRYWRESNTEPARTYFGAQASEEKFKSEAPGNRVIHLATHGYFLGDQCRPDIPTGGIASSIVYAGENPLLLSGLFLAGANRHDELAVSEGSEDGVLTACEVSAMDLSGTDLVVLSACETGLGEVQAGEDVYGLRRAFQMAGARTVISALWSVSDKVAAEIVSRVYDRQAMTLPQQLRALQLERIRALHDQGQPDHPVSWAAFIATGDWR